MPEAGSRLLYFVLHPSDLLNREHRNDYLLRSEQRSREPSRPLVAYLVPYFIVAEFVGLWALDLTAATLILSLATLAIVIKQLILMRRQTKLMQQQTEITIAQDELNRALLARRARLRVYAVESPNRVDVYSVNDGDRAAPDFYWHLAISTKASLRNRVWDGPGNQLIPSVGTVIADGQECTFYSMHANGPLYPTRHVHLAQFNKALPETVAMWGSTVCEDSAGERMYSMDRKEAPPKWATDA
jgi:hypothetical protein